jgi:hypothetical protein
MYTRCMKAQTIQATRPERWTPKTFVAAAQRPMTSREPLSKAFGRPQLNSDAGLAESNRHVAGSRVDITYLGTTLPQNQIQGNSAPHP